MFSKIFDKHQYVSASICIKMSSLRSSIRGGTLNVHISTGMYSLRKTAMSGDEMSLIPKQSPRHDIMDINSMHENVKHLHVQPEYGKSA